ncbi:DUF937 domain-containing protein [Deinococcus lacus]|uniref:DUF937 domain-containing protein n=1 Tax=Deinococcus lacus TaxID=392561 RepID=A0ABW1YF53_9DEIO
MNITEFIQTQFGADSAQHLSRVFGVPAPALEALMDQGVRLQLSALADHAQTAQGQAEILDAIDNIPLFASVAQGLNEERGEEHLKVAGEILWPTLIGTDVSAVARQALAQSGASQVTAEQAERLMHMLLPLVLSFTGQRGLNKVTIADTMAGLRSSALSSAAPHVAIADAARAAGVGAGAPSGGAWKSPPAVVQGARPHRLRLPHGCRHGQPGCFCASSCFSYASRCFCCGNDPECSWPPGPAAYPVQRRPGRQHWPHSRSAGARGVAGGARRSSSYFARAFAAGRHGNRRRRIAQAF